MAAVSVFLISESTLRRSSRVTAGEDLFPVSTLTTLRVPEHFGLLLREWESREEATCKACILPFGRDLKISGICLLNFVSRPRGDWDCVDEALQDVLTMSGS